MKVVVCYGDSNTWGYKPEHVQPKAGFNRYSYEERWPGILQQLLGAGYRVEEEGLNGRTTAFDDPFNPHLNGAKYFDCCMMIKAPVDLLIITLGTNDTKEYFNVNAYCIAVGLEQLILKAVGGHYGQKGGNPEILIISPQPLRDNIATVWLAELFGKGCLEKAKKIPMEYKKIAEKYHCHSCKSRHTIKHLCSVYHFA